jgi:Asp-tRNA(Asn)/Glu-tRNA(Gln) amidotransferase A subunit family amidase
MGLDTTLSRSDFLKGLAGLAALSTLAPLPAGAGLQASDADAVQWEKDMEAMERLIGISFSPAERRAAARQAKDFQNAYKALRESGIGYDLAPCTPFVPRGKMPKATRKQKFGLTGPIPSLPKDPNELPFLPVTELAKLIRSKRLSPVTLTEVCLKRLAKHGPSLMCLITLLEKEAMAEARAAEKEIQEGRWRGPLHGIPYVIKDLFASKGHRTTWGAAPFKDQVTDFDSEVVVRMRQAGAILAAKVTLGALAMDDQWYGGQTKNPWNPKQGSSGSSAGSASSVAAGLVPIAIGTETLGSIVSPSHRCRTVGLRPTFGRISRHGAMPLSWTMDKAGPIGRTPQDCLAVLSAIHGHDPRDSGSVTMPLDLAQRTKIEKLKVARLVGETPLDEEDDATQGWLSLLKDLGVEPVPLKMTPSEDSANIGLTIEGAAVFDAITRDGRLNQVERSFWPTIFRSNRYASAVEYVQSLRLRSRVMDRFEEEFGDFDLVLAGDRGSHLLITTNLTGHPQLYIPLGPDSRGSSRGLSIIGRLYEEGRVCALGQAVTMKKGFYAQRPPGFE